jgi:hypothetical protein
MHTGQMMLALGAMVLLSYLVLRVNNSQLTSQDNMQNTKFGLLAVSLATSVLEDANKRSFDDKTINASVSSTSSLTPAASLGTESGEVYDTFDDVDDYNNYTKLDTSMGSAAFSIKCTVGYVNPSAPDVIVNTQTWHKRILVQVTSKSMKDTIRLSQVFSYWTFL